MAIKKEKQKDRPPEREKNKRVELNHQKKKKNRSYEIEKGETLLIREGEKLEGYLTPIRKHGIMDGAKDRGWEQ